MMNLVCVMLGLLCVEIFAVLLIEVVSLRKKVNKLESMNNTTENLLTNDDINYNPFAVTTPEGFEVTSAEFVRDSEGNWTTKNVQFDRRHDDEFELLNYNPFAVNKPEGYEVKSAEFVRDSEGNWTTKNIQYSRRH